MSNLLQAAIQSSKTLREAYSRHQEKRLFNECQRITEFNIEKNRLKTMAFIKERMGK